MSPSRYEVWLDTPQGDRVAFLDNYLRLEYSKVVHGVGAATLLLPGSFDPALMAGPDYKLEIWRQPEGGTLALDQVALLNGWRMFTDQSGVSYTQLDAACGNDIAQRRRVIAQPNSSLAKGSATWPAYMGNIARQLMRNALSNNCGQAASGLYRDLAATYVTVEANAKDGATYQSGKDYSTRVLLDALNALCQTSAGRGSPIYWYILPIDGKTWQFQIHANQWGTDRSTGPGQIYMTIEDGTLSQAEYVWDATDEYNWSWGMGAKIGYGDPDNRHDGLGYNFARAGKSPFALRETYVDCGGEYNEDLINSTCQEEVAADLPKQSFTMTMGEKILCRYGIDWFLGDKIGATYRNLDYTTRIKSVYVKVSSSGEQIKTTLELSQPVDIRSS